MTTMDPHTTVPAGSNGTNSRSTNVVHNIILQHTHMIVDRTEGLPTLTLYMYSKLKTVHFAE